MKWNAIIIIVLGLIVLAAAALALLHLSSPGQSGPGSTTGAPAPAAPAPARTDALALFDTLRQKINASGQSYGGAALQLINGEATAMVYIYKPVSTDDVDGLLAAGFGALYSTFGSRDPLLVGVVDTTQKISSTQYKVDIYALERPVIAGYLQGDITTAELANDALLITPQSTSLHPNNSTDVRHYIDLNFSQPGNYTPPSNRTMTFDDMIETSGYADPQSLQTGALSDGSKGVSVTLALKDNTTDTDKYSEIESALKACAVSYGDYDHYMITLVPSRSDTYDYYYVDAAAPPVLAFENGEIDQAQLYDDISLTYYTK